MARAKTTKTVIIPNGAPPAEIPDEELGAPSDEFRKIKAEIISAAESQMGNQMAPLVERMLWLAMGGYDEYTDIYQRADQIYTSQVVRDADGNPCTDNNGRVSTAKQLAYPNTPGEQLVLIERKKTTAKPDRYAIADLLNRIMGKPAVAGEPKSEQKQSLPSHFQEALDRAYSNEAQGPFIEPHAAQAFMPTAINTPPQSITSE